MNSLLEEKDKLVTRLRELNDAAEEAPPDQGGQQPEEFQLQYSQVGGWVAG